jgi:hypothetical protein
MNGLRWSCSERSFLLAPVDLALRLAAGLKFEAVDLFVSQGNRHLSSERVLAEPKAVAGEVRLLLRAHSMIAADVRLEVPNIDADGVAAFVSFARNCGASHATWVCDSGCTTELLQRFSNDARNAGIRAAIESSSGVSPQALRTIATQVAGLTVTLDYGAFLEGGSSEEEVNTLLLLVSHLRVRGTCPGSFQVAWNENTVDYERTFRTLQASGYGGFVAADYVWQPAPGHNRNDVIAETVQMRRWLDGAFSS